MKYLIVYIIFYKTGSFTFGNALEEIDDLDADFIRWFERTMLDSDKSFSNAVVINIVPLGG